MLDTCAFFTPLLKGDLTDTLMFLASLKKKKKGSLFDIKKTASFHFKSLFYETNEKKNIYRIITPSICKCVRTDMTHRKHAVRLGYNHESKGLKKEQMDLQEKEYLFSFPFSPQTAFLHRVVASKVVLKVQDVVCLCSFTKLHLWLFSEPN